MSRNWEREGQEKELTICVPWDRVGDTPQGQLFILGWELETIMNTILDLIELGTRGASLEIIVVVNLFRFSQASEDCVVAVQSSHQGRRGFVGEAKIRAKECWDI
jgi:hypothetical protein